MVRSLITVVNDGRSRSAVGKVCGPLGKREGFSRSGTPASFDLMGFEIALEIRD